MRQNVVHLRLPRPSDGPRPCPARHYRFAGDPAEAVGDELFLRKAAAFQEIRDCLVAADLREIGIEEAERRIRFFVRDYLTAAQADGR